MTTRLRDQMTRDLELKGYSEHTKNTYLRNVKHFAQYFNKPPDQLTDEHVKEYLHYLIIEKKVSRSTASISHSSLKFFFETTLQRDWSTKKIPLIKSAKKLPIVLSGKEIASIFDVTENLKHKAILMTTYAGGLRVSETSRLKVSDIDSKSMRIRIEQGKGLKDRYTVLSKINLFVLREYWKKYNPATWLFPTRGNDKPISPRTIQNTFKNALIKAGINKPASPHTLRHSFATHLLEKGYDIHYIQKLMGHRSISTTSVYIHVSKQDTLNIVSPLDCLLD